MYDIHFDLNDMHQTVEETDEYWMVGESFSFDFVDQIRDDHDEDMDDDDFAVIVKRKSNGCVCKKCGETFPYAEPNQKDGTLICWSCRNY